MIAFLRTFFAVIAAVLFLTLVPLVLVALVAVLGDGGPKKDSWLTVRLEGPLLEWYAPATLRELVQQPPPCLMEILENLEKAAVDERIPGVVLRLDAFGAGQGKLDELRAGIRRVREAGKPVYAHAQELTDSGLYLGGACDSVFLFPEGHVHLLGRGVTIAHVKAALEKLDVSEQFHAIDEYKSAVELFTAETSSEEAIENVRWLIEELDAALDSALLNDRGLDPDALPGLRERAVLGAAEAVDAGLVDELLHWDELSDRLRGHHAKLRTVSSQDYADVSRASLGLAGKTKVAVVHTQGFVASSGEDGWDSVWGMVMGPDRVIEDLEAARDDPSVKAILLRVDTGGGATDGSQRMARAVARARDAKPVVVSIADQAASGGYLMSYPANRIVCPANGITGSIGSVLGKFNLRGLYAKLGVTFDTLPFAPNAFLWSGLHDWTDEQWEIVAREHWAFYSRWVEDIARERGLTWDEVHDAGAGKVWTGRQALDRRLVDELGGFAEAIDLVRRLADLDEGAKLAFDHYPAERTLLDVLLSGDVARLAVDGVVRETRTRLAGGRAPAPAGLSWEPRAFR